MSLSPLHCLFILAVSLTALCLSVPAQARTRPEPDWGPNVLVFDPSMPTAEMQSKLDALYSKQRASQFGPDRYTFFFKPGRYDLDVNLGFYTQMVGLGRMPDDVTIHGGVQSRADYLPNGNATCNFWRSAENLAVVPTAPAPLLWAVSQGTWLRRMHIHGDLNLWDRGWSSGGFLADSQIDGEVKSGSQQQWFSRNDNWGSWDGHNWNMVFVGVTRPPSGDWPKPAYTVVAKTPLIREKPYLSWDKNGGYAVWVPALQAQETSGTSWASGPTPGVSVPLDKFYLAHAGRDTAASINAELAAGRNLLLTPGIYHLESSLRVTHPNTIVLGLGYATLVPDKGTPALTVSDVDGVQVAGLIFDAGVTESATLLQVGETGSAKDHRTNPTSLYDIVCRVGGETVGTTASCVTINSHHVIGDNFWIWRADHGAGADWNGNRSKNGLIVNGADVTLYGLFVEHFQEYQTLWNGNGGRVFFYQSELPYDAPTQGDWQHDGVDGFASYKVADGVTRHEAWGLGVYGVFNRSNTKCLNAVETPTVPGVNMHHIIAVWITGRRDTEITHVINGLGEAVNHVNKKAAMN